MKSNQLKDATWIRNRRITGIHRFLSEEINNHSQNPPPKKKKSPPKKEKIEKKRRKKKD